MFNNVMNRNTSLILYIHRNVCIYSTHTQTHTYIGAAVYNTLCVYICIWGPKADGHSKINNVLSNVITTALNQILNDGVLF